MPISSEPLVTIAVPVYKRLDYLPVLLQAIDNQDYGNIELLISDNGMNGSIVPEVVRNCSSKPFRFRQNSATAALPVHLNQLLDEARGEFFILLCDDDLISTNFVSTLAESLLANPGATIAFARIEGIDENGRSVFSDDTEVAELMEGTEFLKQWSVGARWLSGPLATNLARTEDLRRTGGHPIWPRALHTDFALAIKLALAGEVVVRSNCRFYHRRYLAQNSSNVGTSSFEELAVATRNFLFFLDSDEDLQRYAGSNPQVWSDLKPLLVRRIWNDYFHSWRYTYRAKLSHIQWIRMALLMPYIPEYYASILSTIFPRFYEVYRGVKMKASAAELF